MKNRIIVASLLFICVVCVQLTVVHADQTVSKSSSTALSKADNPSINKDIAFTSVMGSRPDATTLRGFQKAILYNAKGAKVKEITFNKNDSIYSLDKMLQENSTKGPLFIKMLR